MTPRPTICRFLKSWMATLMWSSAYAWACSVTTPAAAGAYPAGAQGMADDGVARLDRVHPTAHVFHPPGVFMAQDRRQQRPLGVHRTPPYAFDDMQIGAAQARRTDTHNDLIGGRDGGLRHHLQREIHMHVLVICVQSRGFHRTCSSLSIVPATLLDILAGGSTSQHNIPGQLHVPV